MTTTWQFDPEKRVEMPKKAAAAKPSARNVAVAKVVGETLDALSRPASRSVDVEMGG